MATRSSGRCPCKKRWRRWEIHREDGHVTTEAEVGVTQPPAQNAGITGSWRHPPRSRPDTLVWTPGLQTGRVPSCCFKRHPAPSLTLMPPPGRSHPPAALATPTGKDTAQSLLFMSYRGRQGSWILPRPKPHFRSQSGLYFSAAGRARWESLRAGGQWRTPGEVKSWHRGPRTPWRVCLQLVPAAPCFPPRAEGVSCRSGGPSTGRWSLQESWGDCSPPTAHHPYLEPGSLPGTALHRGEAKSPETLTPS